MIASGEIETGPIAIANDPFGVITALLGEVATSPELRSSVFLATAELPGIESLGTIADPSGRVGIGVAIVESGYRTELIFDSSTSELLSTSVVRVDADGTPTQVLSELTYEVRAIVPSTHAAPPAEDEVSAAANSCRPTTLGYRSPMPTCLSIRMDDLGI